MKRVEVLEARDSSENVDRNVHVNTSVPRSKVRVPGYKPAADLEHEDDFKQVLSDEDELADTKRSRLVVREINKAMTRSDVFDWTVFSHDGRSPWQLCAADRSSEILVFGETQPKRRRN